MTDLRVLAAEYLENHFQWERVGVNAFVRCFEGNGDKWMSITTKEWTDAQLTATSSSPTHFLRMTNGCSNFLRWCIKEKGLPCEIAYANVSLSRVIPAGEQFRREFYFGNVKEFENELREDYIKTGAEHSPNLPVYCMLVLSWWGVSSSQMNVLKRSDVHIDCLPNGQELCRIHTSESDIYIMSSFSVQIIREYRDCEYVEV